MSASEDKNPDICRYFDRENGFAQNSEQPPEAQDDTLNGQTNPDSVSEKELQRESEERFSRYLQDRSQFPAPMLNARATPSRKHIGKPGTAPPNFKP